MENVVPFELEATATSLTLNGNKLSAELKSNEAIRLKMDNSFDITIRNDSQREYLGLINVYTSKNSTKPTFKEGSSSAEEYMCVPAGESTTRTITLKQTANEMYVWVTDRNGEILLDGVKFKVGQIGAGEYRHQSDNRPEQRPYQFCSRCTHDCFRRIQVDFGLQYRRSVYHQGIPFSRYSCPG